MAWMHALYGQGQQGSLNMHPAAQIPPLLAPGQVPLPLTPYMLNRPTENKDLACATQLRFLHLLCLFAVCIFWVIFPSVLPEHMIRKSMFTIRCTT